MQDVDAEQQAYIQAGECLAGSCAEKDLKLQAWSTVSMSLVKSTQDNHGGD